MFRPYGPLLSECPLFSSSIENRFQKLDLIRSSFKSAENRFLYSWATSYSVCGVKRLSSGPSDMPFGSNQMNRSQTPSEDPGLNQTQEKYGLICLLVFLRILI